MVRSTFKNIVVIVGVLDDDGALLGLLAFSLVPGWRGRMLRSLRIVSVAGSKRMYYMMIGRFDVTLMRWDRIVSRNDHSPTSVSVELYRCGLGNLYSLTCERSEHQETVFLLPCLSIEAVPNTRRQ